MPTAILNQPHLRVHLVSERLEVYGRKPDSDAEELLRVIPLCDLERLVASEDVHFTSPALAELLRRGIPIQFFSWRGQFLGSFLPAQNHHGLTRLRQYQRTLDPGFALQMAGRIVTAKLYNQRRVLQRLSASRNCGTRTANCGSEAPTGSGPAPAAQHPTGVQPPLAPAPDPQSAIPSSQSPTPDPGSAIPNPQSAIQSTLRWLDALFASIKTSQTIDELRGYEGAATARYFQAWATFLPPEFPFERRSVRPPLNPVNACISFGATLLYNEAVAFCHAHGLDPALGTLHATEDGRWSLALDLIEPFRPVLVEALALDLFSHQILNASHFEHRDGGCFLNEEGRRKFFLQYERRMERQFLSEAVGHRTTLRQQLEHQALMFKAALEDPAQFEPFLMN